MNHARLMRIRFAIESGAISAKRGKNCYPLTPLFTVSL